jgi:hypothetical protein
VIKRIFRIVLASLSVLGIGWTLNPPAVHADATLVGEKWVDTLKFNGDFRLRHESFFNKTAGAKDRDRERFRLRWGAVATIQDFTVGMRLASGTGEQVSTNQTMGTSFSQKSIFIDQAYLMWKAHESINLIGGRMPNPFWRTYASDVMWDDDINPEGYAIQFDRVLTDRVSLFYNTAALPLNENSTIEADPWLFGNQLGTRLKATEDLKFNVAAELYTPINEKLASLAPNVQQEGNTRVGAGPQLGTAFRIFQFTSEAVFHAGPVPVSVQGDFIRNTQETIERGANGYQTGAVFGKAKSAGTLELAYFYKYLQTNASFADFADSDFGNGGTNRKGHIMWLAYAPRDYVQLRVKYFLTRRLNPFLTTTGVPVTPAGTPQYSDINRLQADIVVKF